jgi:RNA polymerase sigma-70 factor (ECF subfamily)
MRIVQSEPGDLEAALRAARAGQLAAYNVLVHHYQRQIYNVCFRTLGNPEDAADATQETFVGAYRGLAAFRGSPEGLRPWLLRIAVNACYDQLRRRRRRPAESLDALSRAEDDEAASPVDRVLDTSQNPEQSALASETVRAIESALTRLSVDRRVAVVLCDVQGLSYEEAARVMQVELGTVKSRLSRARAQLRDLLIAAGELPGAGRRLEEQRNP